ncbi:expressed unknown protein [Seminavis robusta]|uniref:Uncharacterized protein n=1 Tax=Seminavis robusta TaxID=568900 RepID=A0A9N8ENA5_9STRA|nr:expressed unknown protein [Seminavis robusta]|eukprot:Sro1271_g258090.1 n/a (215) ;mRNA; f:17117-17902
MNYLSFIALLFSVRSLLVASFHVLPFPSGRHCRLSGTAVSQPEVFSRQVVLLGAGFGGDSSKKKKEKKIKPKAQWDRYSGDLKKEKPFRVAVKAEGKKSDEWLEVGNVKSKADEYTMAAVARQRALIAEHARRLFPLQVSTKDKIEWAYWDAEGQDWIIVDKSVLEGDIPDGLEKLIGFEGRPDPATGYYCYYNEGKLVNSEDDLKRSSSKKLK